MTRPEAHEPLSGAAIPVEPDAHRLTLESERHCDSLIRCDSDFERARASLAEMQGQREAIGGLRDHRRAYGPLGQRYLFACQHSFGQAHKLVLDLSFGCPCTCRAKQRAPGTPDDD